MTTILQGSSTGFNIVTPVVSGSTAVKSAGRVNSIEHVDAAKTAEREGGLNLGRGGLLKLPREVLFAQDIQTTKIKATRQGDQVQSSSKTDSDEDRLLNKVKGAEDRFEKIDPDLRKNAGYEHDSDNGVQQQHITIIPLTNTPKSVTGTPSSIYQTLQDSAKNTFNGQQLSVVA